MVKRRIVYKRAASTWGEYRLWSNPGDMLSNYASIHGCRFLSVEIDHVAVWNVELKGLFCESSA